MPPLPRPRQPASASLALVCALQVFILASCNHGDAFAGPTTRVASLVIDGLPPDGVLRTGAAAQLTATALDSHGAVVPNAVISWSSSTSAVASVSSSALLVGREAGFSTIAATAEGHSASGDIAVLDAIAAPADGGDSITTSVLGGAMTLTVPPGATSAGFTLEAGPADIGKLPVSPALMAGTAFTIGPAGLKLAARVTLTIRYDPTGLSPSVQAGLAIYRLDGMSWVAANAGTVNAQAASVSTTIAAVGTYGVFRPIVTANASAEKAEPMFDADRSVSLWHDAFEAPNSTALLAPYTMIDRESGIHLDAAAGLGGSGALRIDWTARACGSDDSHLVERSFAPAKDLYIQYSVKYRAGFVFDWGGSCNGGNAKKLFLLWPVTGEGRFDFISENHTLGIGSDFDHPLYQQTLGGAPVRLEAFGDGKWHRVTLHVVQSSSPNAHDGLLEGWIDGVQRWSVPYWASGSSNGYNLFKIPATFNRGSPVNQSEWMDDLRVWR